jgi:hypothetical protein
VSHCPGWLTGGSDCHWPPFPRHPTPPSPSTLGSCFHWSSLNSTRRRTNRLAPFRKTHACGCTCARGGRRRPPSRSSRCLASQKNLPTHTNREAPSRHRNPELRRRDAPRMRGRFARLRREGTRATHHSFSTTHSRCLAAPTCAEKFIQTTSYWGGGGSAAGAAAGTGAAATAGGAACSAGGGAADGGGDGDGDGDGDGGDVGGSDEQAAAATVWLDDRHAPAYVRADTAAMVQGAAEFDPLLRRLVPAAFARRGKARDGRWRAGAAVD